MVKNNRLKVGLFEKEKSEKWQEDQLGKSTC